VLNFFKTKKHNKTYSCPVGQRAYVIGDVHGCLDALVELLDVIKRDNNDKPSSQTKIIFLGDLIDRGPQSREVVEFLANYTSDFADVIFIKGNHEELFLSILSGQEEVFEVWFTVGGKSTARSYGVDDLGRIHMDAFGVYKDLRRCVPKKHREFLSSFQDYYEFGDFVCVHAGIKPKIPLEKQRPKDMRWIRSSFIDYKKQHDHIVVHGHTVVERAECFGNRIAVDTGAGKGGTLSAVCLEGETWEFLSVPA
jgi:serine/threonine protein phosphatase 1